MKKEVMLVTGAGQISMAIARRIGFGKKIILGDKKIENAKTIAKIMNEAGFDVVPFEMDGVVGSSPTVTTMKPLQDNSCKGFFLFPDIAV